MFTVWSKQKGKKSEGRNIILEFSSIFPRKRKVRKIILEFSFLFFPRKQYSGCCHSMPVHVRASQRLFMSSWTSWWYSATAFWCSVATCNPFAPLSAPSDKNNLACAFSVNVVLTAPRADSGVVCFGVSVAVLFVMLRFSLWYSFLLVHSAAAQSHLLQLSC